MSKRRVGTTWQFSLPGSAEIVFVVVDTARAKTAKHKVLVLVGGTVETKNGPPQLFEEGKTYELSEAEDWDASKLIKRIA